jgi:L-rhamnose-H+ transport protein
MILGASLKSLIVVAVAGVSNGSFPAPSKGLRRWQWEHIWLVYSFCAMGFLPVVLGALLAPGMISRLAGTDLRLAGVVCFFGVLWGVGSLLFGVCLPRLGMAITNALVSGTLAFVGSLGPLLTGAVRIDVLHLLWLLGGLSLLSVSLALCASASVSRDRAQGHPSSQPGKPGRSVWAVLLAILAGVLSSMLNIGFVVGAPLARHALAGGAPSLLASVSIWIPTLCGGLLLNAGYPVYLIWSRRSWRLLVSGPEQASSWFRSSFMGVLWFGAILLYGYGAPLMGQAGAVYGFALIVTMSVLTSNIWGAATGEWKGAGMKPKMLMGFSTALLVCSFFILSSHRMG